MLTSTHADIYKKTKLGVLVSVVVIVVVVIWFIAITITITIIIDVVVVCLSCLLASLLVYLSACLSSNFLICPFQSLGTYLNRTLLRMLHEFYVLGFRREES